MTRTPPTCCLKSSTIARPPQPASVQISTFSNAREWNNKVAGFVAYGGSGGVRAVENLRLVMAEMQVATVRARVGLSVRTDWEAFTTFKPNLQHESSLNTMLDQVVAWGEALKTVREGTLPVAV